MKTKTKTKPSRFTPFSGLDKLAVGINLPAAALAATAGHTWLGLFHLACVALLLLLKVKATDA